MAAISRTARRLVATLLLSCAVAAQADTLIVGNKNEDTVSFIELTTGQERARTATAHAPHEVAISPDRRQAAVVAYGGTMIDIFDVASASLVKRIDLSPGAAPHGIVWLRNGQIVVAAEKSTSLMLVDPRSGSIRAVPTDQAGSHMLVVSPDQRRAYVSNINAGTISIIDLQSLSKVADIAVGGKPEGIAMTRDGRQLWIGDNSAPRLRIVHVATRQTIETLPTDPVPIRVAISPDGKTAVTSNIGTGSLSVFDVATRKPLKSITISGARDAIQVTAVFAPDGRKIYVAESGRGTIAEVDLATGQVVRRIAAGKGADGLGLSR